MAWCLSVRAAERNPDEIIKRVTEQVVASAARIPSYTCVETIVREYYRPTAAILPRACPVLIEQRQHPTPDIALQLAMTDRLRLDVTMTGRGEIFSWVGASRFDDRSIFQMVGGPMVTGAFGGFLSVIFKQDVHKFTFERGTEVEGGRRLMEYSFEVSRENSSYRVEIPGSSVKTGYNGTVLADAVTGDVIGLTVKTRELPAVANACEISTNLVLHMVKIGDSEFLLPAQARQRYVINTAEETQNTTTFASCREYVGESRVSFNAPKSGTRGFGPSAPAAVRVPAEQRFTVELTAPIASLAAAAGDAFSGRLLTPLRDERRRTLARTGSLVEGRILRVERHHVAPAFTVVALKLERVEIGGSMVLLTAVRDWSRELYRRTGKAHVQIPLPLPSEKNAAVFRFAGDQAVVPRGYRSDWRTLETEEQDHNRRQGY